LNKAFKEVLEEIGFKKAPRELLYYKEYNDGVQGFIGISSAACGYTNVQFVNVMYAITNKNIQKQLFSLIEKKPHNGNMCNAMRGIYSLMPGKSYNDMVWKVENESEVFRVARNAADYIKRIVFPVFETFNTWQKYKCGVMTGFLSTVNERNMIIPIIHYLEGDLSKGKQYIEDVLKRNPNAYKNSYDQVLFLQNYKKL